MRMMVLALLVLVWLAIVGSHSAQIPAPEGAMGVVGHPFERPVRMTGESYVLATGTVDAAEHEQADGFFAVRKVSLSVPKDSIPADILRQLRGREVELVIRPVLPRQLERVVR